MAAYSVEMMDDSRVDVKVGLKAVSKVGKWAVR